MANLMTIHASKGMEFDSVFLVGNEEGKSFINDKYLKSEQNERSKKNITPQPILYHLIGTFPTQRPINMGHGLTELYEEHRLCYVAMTRAKTYLVMTWRREVVQFFGQGIK